MQYNEILKKLKAQSNPKAVEGMARFGINPENTYGVSIPNLRKFLPIIKGDNWAPRKIGKRNQSLNRDAIKMARRYR